MSVSDSVKKSWEKLQSEYSYPVDTLGRPIDPKDEESLNVWREEGIDRFMQK